MHHRFIITSKPDGVLLELEVSAGAAAPIATIVASLWLDSNQTLHRLRTEAQAMWRNYHFSHDAMAHMEPAPLPSGVWIFA